MHVDISHFKELYESDTMTSAEQIIFILSCLSKEIPTKHDQLFTLGMELHEECENGHLQSNEKCKQSIIEMLNYDETIENQIEEMFEVS